MTDEATSDDDAALHKKFAIDLNNGVYGAIEGLGPESTATDKDKALYAAFASTYHWLQVGNEANHARGEYLIAKAALAVGDNPLALQHARRCLELIEAHPEVMDDWDAPFGYEVLARGLAGTGDTEGAEAALAEQARLTELVADPEDREVIVSSMDEPPWFGLR